MLPLSNETDELRVKLFRIVKKKPGLPTREYKRLLGLGPGGKRKLNRIFYRNRHLFSQDGSVPPRWQISTKIKPDGKNAVGDVTSFNAQVSKQSFQLYSWQREALQAWQCQNRTGVIEAVTGSGKSWIGLAATKEMLVEGGNILILVPTLELLEQWNNLLADFFKDISIGVLGGGRSAVFTDHRIIVSTVQSARASAKLGPKTNNALIIADECHRYGSGVSQVALDHRFKQRLGLTATLERCDDGVDEYLRPYFGRSCFQLDFKRALKDEVISRFCAGFIGATFSSDEERRYNELSSAIADLRTGLIHRFHVTPEPFGEFIKQVSDLSSGDSRRVVFAKMDEKQRDQATKTARIFLSQFTKRRTLLAETSVKLAALEKVVPAIMQSNRTLIFTQTVASANQIALSLKRHNLSAHSIHGGTQKIRRKQLFEKFSEGEIRVLVAPHILDEGIDVPDADLGIIVAGSKTRREMIQRMGRILRKKSDNRIARFALLFVEGTSEDPNRGAHEAFIEEVTENAIATRRFCSKASSDEICKYLERAGT